MDQFFHTLSYRFVLWKERKVSDIRKGYESKPGPKWAIRFCGLSQGPRHHRFLGSKDPNNFVKISTGKLPALSQICIKFCLNLLFFCFLFVKTVLIFLFCFVLFLYTATRKNGIVTKGSSISFRHLSRLMRLWKDDETRIK